jgi:hypothetical protein
LARLLSLHGLFSPETAMVLVSLDRASLFGAVLGNAAANGKRLRPVAAASVNKAAIDAAGRARP